MGKTAWNVGAGAWEGSREKKCVYEWFKRFREEKKTTEDEPLSGQPPTSRTSEMIEKVRQMLAQDRRLTLRLIAEELGTSKDTAHTIVRDELSKRKICSRFVPHKFTDEHKAKWMEISGDFISNVSRIQIASGKHRHGRWDLVLPVRSGMKTTIDGVVFNNIPVTKKNRLQKSKTKTLLMAFFDNKGIIHKEFVPSGQTINVAFYQAVLNRLLQSIRRVWPELHRTGNGCCSTIMSLHTLRSVCANSCLRRW